MSKQWSVRRRMGRVYLQMYRGMGWERLQPKAQAGKKIQRKWFCHFWRGSLPNISSLVEQFVVSNRPTRRSSNDDGGEENRLVKIASCEWNLGVFLGWYKALHPNAEAPWWRLAPCLSQVDGGRDLAERRLRPARVDQAHGPGDPGVECRQGVCRGNGAKNRWNWLHNTFWWMHWGKKYLIVGPKREAETFM